MKYTQHLQNLNDRHSLVRSEQSESGTWCGTCKCGKAVMARDEMDLMVKFVTHAVAL